MDGFSHLKACLTIKQQKALLADVQNILEQAPFYQPTMPKSGRPFSVKETNCGPLGWVSDKGGYRYQSFHPDNGAPWPPIPKSWITLWHHLTNVTAPPEAALINYYNEKARMGLHQDRDEEDFNAPVLSVSLGNSAVFRLGGLKRRDKTNSIILASGDVIILAGAARLCFHGIDRIIPESSDLFEPWPALAGGRINITMRRVTSMQPETL